MRAVAGGRRGAVPLQGGMGVSHTLIVLLLLVTGLFTSVIILFTSSVLFGCWIVESVRRILRVRPRKPRG
jgi:hypothetical protein